MSASGGTPPPPGPQQADQAAQRPERSQRPGWWRRHFTSEVQRHGGGIGTGYTVISYLLGGIIAYGAIGWLIGRWTGLTHILLPAGMLLGLAVSTGWIIYRYGRS